MAACGSAGAFEHDVKPGESRLFKTLSIISKSNISA